MTLKMKVVLAMIAVAAISLPFASEHAKHQDLDYLSQNRFALQDPPEPFTYWWFREFGVYIHRWRINQKYPALSLRPNVKKEQQQTCVPKFAD